MTTIINYKSIRDIIDDPVSKQKIADAINERIKAKLESIYTESDGTTKSLTKSEAYSKVIKEMYEKTKSISGNLISKEESKKFFEELYRPHDELMDSINNKIKQIEKLKKDKIDKSEINGISVKDENPDEIQKIKDKINELEKEIFDDLKKSDSLDSHENQEKEFKQIQEFTLSKTLESIKKL